MTTRGCAGPFRPSSYALDAGATAVLASHLGRPKGKKNPQFSLRPIVDPLAELLGRPVTFVEDCVGDEVKRTIDQRSRGGRRRGAA